MNRQELSNYEQAQQALALSEARLRDALAAISEAFVLYGPDGCLIACNQNFRDLYGYSEEEAKPGVHFQELGLIDIARGNVVTGDEQGDGETYLQRKAEYRRKLQGSFIVQLKDGRWLNTTDRRTTEGGFVSIQSDITELKRAEEDMAEAKRQAEIANQAKSE
ncbi:MAG: PAS-domain containing protein, partial [Rhodovibrionaceae bacterium]